jgi:hypothetical protein
MTARPVVRETTPKDRRRLRKDLRSSPGRDPTVPRRGSRTHREVLESGRRRRSAQPCREGEVTGRPSPRPFGACPMARTSAGNGQGLPAGTSPSGHASTEPPPGDSPRPPPRVRHRFHDREFRSVRPYATRVRTTSVEWRKSKSGTSPCGGDSGSVGVAGVTRGRFGVALLLLQRNNSADAPLLNRAGVTHGRALRLSVSAPWRNRRVDVGRVDQSSCATQVSVVRCRTHGATCLGRTARWSR